MIHIRRNIVGLLLTAFVFSLYCILPFIGAVSLGAVLGRLVICFVVLTVVCLLAYKALKHLLPGIHCKKIEAVIYDKCSDRIFFLTLWGILILGWIPAYLAFFPGIFGYDAPRQMLQVSGVIPYSSHHPLLHTVVLGFFMNCGRAVFGTYNGGVALFCAFQGLVLSGSIASSFRFMRRFRIPFPILVVSLIWCIRNPVLQVLTFNTTKDILYGAMLLHFTMNCYEWVADKGKRGYLQNFMLVFSGVLMCLLRNQGIYIVAVLAIISMLVNWGDRRFLVSLCVVVLLSQLFFTVAYHMGVEKADAREMLSVPMQQMALVCSEYIRGGAVNLTPDEFEQFTELVYEEHIPEYLLYTADPIKNHFQTERLKQDLPGYLFLYIKVGLHNPGYYLMAFRSLVYPYWDMAESINRSISITNAFPDISEGRWGITRESLLPEYEEYLSDYILNKMDERIPVVSWILQPGLCIWITTALAGLSFVRKNKGAFAAAMAGMLFFGTILLGPIALMRYLYPLMIHAPWFLALLCDTIVSAK